MNERPAPTIALGQAGFSVVEVLVASLVAGIAIVGVALTLGSGSALVSILGEDRVALGLAEQQVEVIRDAGWGAAIRTAGWDGSTLKLGLGTVTEPCARVGGRPSLPAGEPCPDDERTFSRVTCVQYVAVDPDRPESLGEPAYAEACPAGAPSAVPTVRITVSVTQNGQPQATPVVLQAWLTESGR